MSASSFYELLIRHSSRLIQVLLWREDYININGGIQDVIREKIQGR